MATRSVPAGLLAHYQQRTTSLCYLLKIVRAFDGVTKGYTSHSADLVVDGVTYERGLEVSTIQTLSGYVVGNLEVQIFPDAEFTAQDLLAGKWNNAYFTLGICCWRDTTLGVDILKAGYTGQANITDQGFFTMEFRGLMQAWQQPLGHSTQKTCRWEFGSTSEATGGFCMVDLAPYTFSDTVNVIASQRSFTAASLSAPDDYFKEGRLKFSSGFNAGYEFKVKAWVNSTKTFTLASAVPFPLTFADGFVVIAGCQKRWEEDCKGKYNNILNFGGEKDVPGGDKLLADPDVQG